MTAETNRYDRSIFNLTPSFLEVVFLLTEQENEKEGAGETAQKSSGKILRLIAANPEISSKEIAAILTITQRGAEKSIAKLKAAGVLRRVGPDKGGHWELVK